jgi:hypothetical protein
MTTKFLALMSLIGLAAVCVVQAQSPTPSKSPPRNTLSGGESCIALTPGASSGFARSKTHSQESEGCDETASGAKPVACRAHNRGSGKSTRAGRRPWSGVG